jgi:hypothetical protein
MSLLPRCGVKEPAPTGQKAHSTGQRPVKIAPKTTLALKGQKPILLQWATVYRNTYLFFRIHAS